MIVNIAGIIVSLMGETAFFDSQVFQPYLCSSADIQWEYNFYLVDFFDGEEKMNQVNMNTNEVCCSNTNSIFYNLTAEAGMDMQVVHNENKRITRINILRGREELLKNQIVDVLDLKRHLLEQKGVLLHSSFVKWKQKGIIFCGPSGVGKSTQANLWNKYLMADIVNGDRTALKKDKDGWRCYGTPYAGSSNYRKNDNAPLTQLILLEHGTENRIELPEKAELFKRILEQVPVPWKEREQVKKAMDVVEMLIDENHIIKYSCRPDESAVVYLKDYIEGTNHDISGTKNK